jgi:hypothetical protein
MPQTNILKPNASNRGSKLNGEVKQNSKGLLAQKTGAELKEYPTSYSKRKENMSDSEATSVIEKRSSQRERRTIKKARPESEVSQQSATVREHNREILPDTLTPLHSTPQPSSNPEPQKQPHSPQRTMAQKLQAPEELQEDEMESATIFLYGTGNDLGDRLNSLISELNEFLPPEEQIVPELDIKYFEAKSMQKRNHNYQRPEQVTIRLPGISSPDAQKTR